MAHLLGWGEAASVSGKFPKPTAPCISLAIPVQPLANHGGWGWDYADLCTTPSSVQVSSLWLGVGTIGELSPLGKGCWMAPSGGWLTLGLMYNLADPHLFGSAGGPLGGEFT